MSEKLEESWFDAGEYYENIMNQAKNKQEEIVVIDLPEQPGDEPQYKVRETTGESKVVIRQLEQSAPEMPVSELIGGQLNLDKNRTPHIDPLEKSDDSDDFFGENQKTNQAYSNAPPNANESEQEANKPKDQLPNQPGKGGNLSGKQVTETSIKRESAPDEPPVEPKDVASKPPEVKSGPNEKTPFDSVRSGEHPENNGNDDREILGEDSDMNVVTLFTRNLSTTPVMHSNHRLTNPDFRTVNTSEAPSQNSSFQRSEIFHRQDLATLYFSGKPAPSDPTIPEVLKPKAQSLQVRVLPAAKEEIHVKSRVCRLLQIDIIENMVILASFLLQDEKQKGLTDQQSRIITWILNQTLQIAFQVAELLSRRLAADRNQQSVQISRRPDIEEDEAEYNRLRGDLKQLGDNKPNLLPKSAQEHPVASSIIMRMLQLSKSQYIDNPDIKKMFRILVCTLWLSDSAEKFTEDELMRHVDTLERNKDGSEEEFIKKFEIEAKYVIPK